MSPDDSHDAPGDDWHLPPSATWLDVLWAFALVGALSAIGLYW